MISRRTAMGMGVATLAAAAGAGRARGAPSAAVAQAPAFAGSIGDYYAFNPPQKAPPMVFGDASGLRRHLGDMAGKVVLLNFWATWCAPCLVEMPGLDGLQARSPGDLVVLALCTNLRSARSVADFYATHGLTRLGVYFDPTGQDLGNWALATIPTSFVVDRAGRVRGILPGAAAWNSPAAAALMNYYLAEKSRANTPDATGA